MMSLTQEYVDCILAANKEDPDRRRFSASDILGLHAPGKKVYPELLKPVRKRLLAIKKQVEVIGKFPVCMTGRFFKRRKWTDTDLAEIAQLNSWIAGNPGSRGPTEGVYLADVIDDPIYVASMNGRTRKLGGAVRKLGAILQECYAEGVLSYDASTELLLAAADPKKLDALMVRLKQLKEEKEVEEDNDDT